MHPATASAGVDEEALFTNPPSDWANLPGGDNHIRRTYP